MDEKRETAIKVRKGIHLYKGSGDTWRIEYPDGAWRSGTTTTIKVMTLVYHLGRGKSLDMARKMTFGQSEF